ncbi:MAG: IS30 family transposase [Actinomycetota bacterium]
MSNAEACRVVGVNPRTGKRWRHGRTITVADGRRRHYPIVVAGPVQEISPRFLSEDERVRLGDLRAGGAGVREIARRLGRAPSTISRELRRDVGGPAGPYRPFTAHRAAVTARARPGRGKIRADAVLRGFVEARLQRRWSPEQIAHASRVEFPDDPARHLSAETIYQAVYRPELGGLCRELPAVLRSRRRRRRSRVRPDGRRAGALRNLRMIDERPAEAADRGVPGHWEGDLILGAGNRSAIGTVVDRASRVTLLVHLPAGRHTAEAVRDALLAVLSGLPAGLRRSLTWDQGNEMALHAEVAAALAMPVFFCDPHSPWQRPSNENTNGLLRQYFPKGTDLRAHTPADLAAVEKELNARPRKVLDWATPEQRLTALLGAAVGRR